MPTTRPWRTPRLPDLVTTRGAIEILGISRMTFSRWRRDGLVPPPPRRAGGTSIWVKSDIEHIARDYAEQRAAGIKTHRLVPPSFPWRTNRLPALVAITDACRILRVERPQMYRWLEPDSGNRGAELTFMIPPRVVDGAQIWVRADVARFRAEAAELGKKTAEGDPAWASRPRSVTLRPYRLARVADLIDKARACEILGVSPAQIDAWLAPDSGTYGPEGTFMPTAQWLNGEPIWVRVDIERFAKQLAASDAPS